MRFMVRFAIALLVGVVATSTFAQGQPPNQTDLHAAYCIETLKSFIARYGQYIAARAKVLNADPNTPKSLRDSAASDQAAVDTAGNNLQKLRLYMASRLPYIDALGLVDATRTAGDDQDRVETMTNKCSAQCPVSANPKALPAETKCNNECTARLMPDLAAVRQSFKTCQMLNWLPY